MDSPESTVCYWPRRKPHLLVLIYLLLVAAAGGWLIDAALLGGRFSGTSVNLPGRDNLRVLLMIPIICILGFSAALYAVRLLNPRPSLTLTPEGMEFRPFYGSARFVGWDEISEVSIFDYRLEHAARRYGIGIGLRDPDRYLKRLGFYGREDAKSNACKIGYHLFITTALVSEPLENVQKVMQRFLDMSRQTEARSA